MFANRFTAVIDACVLCSPLKRNLILSLAEAAVTDYDHLGDGLGKLPDDGDRHVIAAAIKSKSDVIVTENLKDFPKKLLARYGIEAKCSDEFIADAIDLSPSLAIAAIKRMRLRLQRPEKTPEVLLLDMEKTGLTNSADQLRDSVKLI